MKSQILFGMMFLAASAEARTEECSDRGPFQVLINTNCDLINKQNTCPYYEASSTLESRYDSIINNYLVAQEKGVTYNKGQDVPYVRTDDERAKAKTKIMSHVKEFYQKYGCEPSITEHTIKDECIPLAVYSSLDPNYRNYDQEGKIDSLIADGVRAQNICETMPAGGADNDNGTSYKKLRPEMERLNDVIADQPIICQNVKESVSTSVAKIDNSCGAYIEGQFANNAFESSSLDAFLQTPKGLDLKKCIDEKIKIGLKPESITIETSASQVNNTGLDDQGKKICAKDFKKLSSLRADHAQTNLIPKLITDPANIPTNIVKSTLGSNKNGSSGPCPYIGDTNEMRPGFEDHVDKVKEYEKLVVAKLDCEKKKASNSSVDCNSKVSKIRDFEKQWPKYAQLAKAKFVKIRVGFPPSTQATTQVTKIRKSLVCASYQLTCGSDRKEFGPIPSLRIPPAK